MKKKMGQFSVDLAKTPVDTSSPFPASVLIPFLKIMQNIYMLKVKAALAAGLQHSGTERVLPPLFSAGSPGSRIAPAR